MLNFIFVATKFEVSQALARYNFRPLRGYPFRMYENSRSVVVETGIGLVSAANAFAWTAANFRFERAANIGAVGDVSGLHRLGDVVEISKISCIEPYDRRIFHLGKSGVSLASSASPVVSNLHRARAAMLADVVDMEAYALASSAVLFKKALRVTKFVSDFSPTCNIRANIMRLRGAIADLDNFWLD